MAVPDAQTLIASANCYNCFGNFELIKLGLLRQIALSLNPMADVTAQTLIASGNCYNCYGNLALIELALLALIVNQGLGGGSSQIVAYTGANPNADGVKPPNTQAQAIAVKPSSTTYTWSVAAQTWT